MEREHADKPQEYGRRELLNVEFVHALHRNTNIPGSTGQPQRWVTALSNNLDGEKRWKTKETDGIMLT